MKQLHRRVVVTGLGILSPIGNTLDEAWDSCINGISGITNIDIDSNVSNENFCLVLFFKKADLIAIIKSSLLDAIALNIQST